MAKLEKKSCNGENKTMCTALQCCTKQGFSSLRCHKVGAKIDIAIPSKCERIKENEYQTCVFVCVPLSLLVYRWHSFRSPHLLIIKLEQTGFARECEGS